MGCRKKRQETTTVSHIAPAPAPSTTFLDASKRSVAHLFLQTTHSTTLVNALSPEARSCSLGQLACTHTSCESTTITMPPKGRHSQWPVSCAGVPRAKLHLVQPKLEGLNTSPVHSPPPPPSSTGCSGARQSHCCGLRVGVPLMCMSVPTTISRPP